MTDPERMIEFEFIRLGHKPIHLRSAQADRNR
jgi:hypothetical protein